MCSSCDTLAFWESSWRFWLMDPKANSILIGTQLLIYASMTSAPESLCFIKLFSWLGSIIGWFKGYTWRSFMLNAFFRRSFLMRKLLCCRLRFRCDFYRLILLDFWLSLAIRGSWPDSLWLRSRFCRLTLFSANSYLLDHPLPWWRCYVLTDIPIKHWGLILNLMFLCISGFHLWIIWISCM